jgi:hypothetical protein
MPLADTLKKESGDVLRSDDWNVIIKEIDRKINRDGADTLKGPLTITEALKVNSNVTVKGSLNIVFPQPQDPNGQILVLGTTDASNLRLGYHQDYSWIQSHGGKPLLINRLGNNIGIGSTINPVASLDIASASRTGTHPTAVKGLYITGDFNPDNDGVEFRHSSGTQGIGFGFNTIYAAGSAANQDLGLKPKGTGEVKVAGNLSVTGLVNCGNLSVTGSVSSGNLSVTGSVSFGVTGGQMLNLWSNTYGIGVQGWTQYFRSDANFAWYKGGSHNGAELNPGGGTSLMTLDANGKLSVSGNLSVTNVLEIGDPPFGNREWMQKGIKINWDSDSLFIGLKNEGTNRKDAVIAWGDDPQDDLRFVNVLYGGDVQGKELMRIKPSGNVGIGISTPNDTLDVAGSLRILTGSNPIRFTSSWSAFPDAATNQAEISNDTGIYKTLMIVGNRSAGLDRRVSIWDRLEVNGQLEVTSSAIFVGNIGTSGYNPNGGGNYPDGWGGGVHTFDVVAEATVGYSNIQKWSSIKEKNNIRPLGKVLDKLDKLNPVFFDRMKQYRNGKANNLGFIAEEVREVFPEIIEEYNPDNPEFFAAAMQMDAIATLSIAGIQELSRKLKILKQGISVDRWGNVAIGQKKPLQDHKLYISGDLRIDCKTSAEASSGQAILPANPVGFMIINVGGKDYKIPYYDL